MGFSLVLCFVFFIPSLYAQQPSFGLAYELRQLHDFELLPQYRDDTKLYQISSYDTTGGNNDGFGGTYSFVRKEGNFHVLADLKGPGVVNRIATPTPTTGMLSFYFDGEATPRIRLPYIELFSGKHFPFVKQLVGNEVGGYFCYYPIVYSKSLKIVYEGSDMRFHQIQYRTYPAGSAVTSFTNMLSAPEQKELDKAANRFNNNGNRPFAIEDVKSVEKSFSIKPGQSLDLLKLTSGGRIEGIEMIRPSASDVILQVNWDNDKAFAVNSPVNDFFGYSFNKPATQSLLLGSKQGVDYCYYPMPFDQSASIRLLAGKAAGPVSGTVRIYYSQKKRNPSTEGKFFAVWRRDNPAKGTPHLFFTVKGKGHHVATILQAQGLEEANTGFFEGDEVAIADGEMRMHGTGSEDYFNGGWYWILDRWDHGMSLPMYGCLDYDISNSRTGGYRLYLTDKVPFTRDYTFTIEHGPERNESPVEYASLALYYGTSASPSGSDPLAFAGPMKSPPRHHYHARDFNMTLNPGTKALYTGYDRVMEISAVIPDNSWFVDEEDKTDSIGRVRIDFASMKPGRYNVLVYYEQGPDCGEFSLWRRQQLISDWISTNAAEKKIVENVKLGEVEFTDQVKTLTFKTRPNRKGKFVRINRVVFEEIPEN
jgi:hypothetical protein